MTSSPVSTTPSATLRILQVLEPSGGGSGRHFLDLCRGLRERGNHVEAVYSPLRAEDAFVRELKSLGLAAVHAVAMKRAPGPSDVAAFRALHRIIATNPRFDVVHGHSSKAGALTRLRLPGPHIPRVYTPHAFRTMDPTLGKGGRILYGAIEIILARLFTDRLICVSNDEYAHARSLCMPARRLSTIVNGVTPPPMAMARTVRSSFGIPDGDFVFGFVGRLSHQKAPERLIEAFRSAASRLPNARLIVVGSGELEGDIRRLIADSDLQNRIHLTSAFTGAQAVPAFDVLVMPSRYEAMSYVMLEAAAAGKPIISTDVGGAATVIDNGANGVIVANDGDTGKLASSMVECANPERYADLEAAALSRMSAFSAETMIDQTEALYRQLARRR